MPDILDRLIDDDQRERKKEQFNFSASPEDIDRIKGLARKLRISTAMLLRIGARYIEIEYEKRLAARATKSPVTSAADAAPTEPSASTRDDL